MTQKHRDVSFETLLMLPARSQFPASQIQYTALLGPLDSITNDNEGCTVSFSVEAPIQQQSLPW